MVNDTKSAHQLFQEPHQVHLDPEFERYSLFLEVCCIFYCLETAKYYQNTVIAVENGREQLHGERY